MFQAYGSYVAPVGRGLNIDFGKFAGALKYEGNYTKEEFTYSRAYCFNFLPFYHMGFRSTYELSDRVSLTHCLINGAQQTEDFNGFKSNTFLLDVKPASKLSWNIKYYFGREVREYVPVYNTELPEAPSQPGLPPRVIRPAPDGRFHAFSPELKPGPWLPGKCESVLLKGLGGQRQVKSSRRGRLRQPPRRIEARRRAATTPISSSSRTSPGP